MYIFPLMLLEAILNRKIFRSLLGAGIEDNDETCLSQHTEKDCSLNYSEGGYCRSPGDLEMLLHGEHIKYISLVGFQSKRMRFFL